MGKSKPKRASDDFLVKVARKLDKGCPESPKCLRCPVLWSRDTRVSCWRIKGIVWLGNKITIRNKIIRMLFAEGVGRFRLATRFGVSISTVTRVTDDIRKIRLNFLKSLASESNSDMEAVNGQDNE